MTESTPIRGRRTPASFWFLAGLALLAASVVVYWRLIATYPGLWLHTDEWVYRAAGALIRRHPAALYHQHLGAPGQAKLLFTYPPFAALVFALGSSFSFGAWQFALVAIDVILLPVIAYASVRICGQRGLRAAAIALALAAAALWLEPVYMGMFFGQINLILLALIIVDFALPDSSPLKGIGIGIAAGVKLTPLVFIPYLLASRRVRAGVVALVTFAATALIGFAFLPAASRDYWGGQFAVPGDSPGRVQNQSLNGTVQRLLAGSPSAHTVWLLAALVVAAVGLVAAVAASRRGLELLGIVLCAVVGLLVSPISWTHHWVWVVPALALMVAGARRGGPTANRARVVRPRDWIARGLGAAVILAVFAMWPAPRGVLGRAVHLWMPIGSLRLAINDTGHGFLGHAGYFVMHNLYVAVAVAAVAGAAAYLWATRARVAGLPAPEGAGDHLVPASPPEEFRPVPGSTVPGRTVPGRTAPRGAPGPRAGDLGRVAPREQS